MRYELLKSRYVTSYQGQDWVGVVRMVGWIDGWIVGWMKW